MSRPPDPQRLQRRATYVREQIERLRGLGATVDEDTFAAEGSWIASGARYALQTAIEGLVDVAYHVCARRFSYAPPDARSAFRRLADAGLLDRTLTAKMLGMVGFRNVVVHGYDHVSDARVYGMIRDELGDLEAALASLEAAAAAPTPPGADADTTPVP